MQRRQKRLSVTEALTLCGESVGGLRVHSVTPQVRIQIFYRSCSTREPEAAANKLVLQPFSAFLSEIHAAD